MMKALKVSEVKNFNDIPNVGPAMIADFVLLDIATPRDLQEKDAYTLYVQLCEKTRARQDPCVLDTFIAVVDFMNGGSTKPWWRYTTFRKLHYPNI